MSFLRLGSRSSPSKTALVLAGGGVTGVAYEIGALQALEERWGAYSANDFDLYVGTSAGAVVSALLANGVTLQTMRQVMASEHPLVRAPQVGDVFAWDTAGLLRWGLHLPRAMWRAWAARVWPPDWSALLLALTEALPSGLCDSRALACYLREAVAALGGTDRFADLRRELYLIATDLDTGERVVFGQDGPGVSISEAVAASTALPLVYKPVRLGDRIYVDGGLRGNASVDIAIEQGARLVVCINPVVPPGPQRRARRSAAGATCGDLAWRTLRINSHAGLHYHLKHLQQRHPDVDIVCIEPGPNDEDHLATNAMQFSARHRLLSQGYAGVRQRLDEDDAYYAAAFRRHGLPWRSGESTVPEAGEGDRSLEPVGPRLRGRPATVRGLRRALKALERALGGTA